MSKKRRKYTVPNFLFDCMMFVLTGGMWCIWIYVRESRLRTRELRIR